VEGWLDLLRRERHRILVDATTTAGQLERTRRAVDRYRLKLRWRGEHIDLRPLGATLPPFPFDDADAKVRVIARERTAETAAISSGRFSGEAERS
jgi:hypothetical protein